MKIFSRRERIVLLTALVLFILIGVFPPWRYLDGSFAGFRPVFSPPPAQSDTLAGEPAPEYTEIHLIPMAMYNMERKSQFSEEEMIRPYLDIRKMMGLGAFVFLGSIIAILLLNNNQPSRSKEKTPRPS
ncbi:hypothetical protein KQI63_16230 [bacterium]|nr:hypothetical protein [bacterium]